MAYQFAPTDGYFDFDRLCRRFTPRIQRAVLDRTGDAHLAEDVAQETFFRVYRYRDNFDPGRPVWPWLFTVYARVCSNMTRGKQPHIEPLTADLDGELSAVFPDPNLDPEEQMIAKEGEILATLPPRYRRVLIMRYVEGLSYEEIAKEEGISVAGIDSLLLRARRRFRKAVEGRNGHVQLALVLPIQRLIARARDGAERIQRRATEATAWLAADTVAAAATTGIAVAAAALASVIAAPTAAGAHSVDVIKAPDRIVRAASASSASASAAHSSAPASTTIADGSHVPTSSITLDKAVQPSINTASPGEGGVGPASTEVTVRIYDPITGKEKVSSETVIPCEHWGSFDLTPRQSPVRAAC